MIVHHQQAIEMSDVVLAKDSIDPKVTALAIRIKEAQSPEITQLNGWLRQWGFNQDEADHSMMGHDDGMMSDDDMSQLSAAQGAEASRLFLEQMIVHHEGAITMAEEELHAGVNPDALALARTIIDAQTAEIAEMRGLLEAL